MGIIRLLSLHLNCIHPFSLACPPITCPPPQNVMARGKLNEAADMNQGRHVSKTLDGKALIFSLFQKGAVKLLYPVMGMAIC